MKKPGCLEFNRDESVLQVCGEYSKPIIFGYQDSMESKKLFFLRGSQGIFNKSLRIHTRRKEGITSIES